MQGKRILGDPASTLRGPAWAPTGKAGAQNNELPAGAGYKRGDDIGRMAVERHPCSVVAHRGAGVGVRSRLLDVAEGNARVQTGRPSPQYAEGHEELFPAGPLGVAASGGHASIAPGGTGHLARRQIRNRAPSARHAFRLRQPWPRDGGGEYLPSRRLGAPPACSTWSRGRVRPPYGQRSSASFARPAPTAPGRAPHPAISAQQVRPSVALSPTRGATSPGAGHLLRPIERGGPGRVYRPVAPRCPGAACRWPPTGYASCNPCARHS